MNLTEIAIKRPSLIIVIFIVLSFLGIASYFTMPYELVPKFSPPVLVVSTIYPGAPPSEVENSVTKPIEDAISVVENVDVIQSASQENISMMKVELKQGADVDKVVQDIQRRVNAISNKLPETAKAPSINKFDFDELPIIRLALFADKSPTELYDFAKNTVQPQIAQIPGVADVAIFGGTPRELNINVKAKELDKYGLSLLQVNQAVQQANLDFPTGKVKDDNGQQLIRLSGKFTSLEQIRQLEVGKSMNGTTIRLYQVAEVEDTQRDAEILSRVNATPALMFSIQKNADANAIEISKAVHEKIAGIETKNKAANVKFVYAQDSSEFTTEAADAVIHDLMIAVLLVCLVMLLFLHSLRNSLIVLISIPASIVSTFIMMSVLGYSFNLMSLLGLSLAIGILVDDSIVVIENIYRHLEHGKNRVQASYDGRMEIGFTALSITLVDVVVFLPLILSTGLVADLLRQFAMVIFTSTLMSLFVSFTLVPFLTSRLSKLEHFNVKRPIGWFVIHFERFIDWLSEGINVICKWALNNKIITLAAASCMLIGSCKLTSDGYIGTAFFDPGDRGEFIIELELPRDATLEQTNAITKRAEAFISNRPEVKSFFTTVGTTSRNRSGQPVPYTAEINVQLVPREQRGMVTNVLARVVKAELEGNIAGVKVRPIDVDLLGIARDAPVEIIVQSAERDTAAAFANRLKSVTRSIQGTVEVTTSEEGSSNEMSIRIDRDKLAQYGLTLAQVGAATQIAFAGNDDAKYRDKDFEYDIRIRMDEFNRKSKDDLASLSFVNNRGKLIRLHQFAEITEIQGPAKLDRKDRIASVSVTSQVVGRPVGTVSVELQDTINKIPKPNGVSIDYGGDIKQQSQGFGTMGFALLTSIIFVYLIMVALYNSFVYPLVVLFSIPLAVIGALLALALMKQNLTIFSMLGMLIMIGLVAKNAILVVDFTNQLKSEGRDVRSALLESNRLRFRPILMTTLAMIIGLLPIALAKGAGSEWKNGLAYALIGGLSSSMLLSLVVVPVVYLSFDNILRWLRLDKTTPVVLDTSGTAHLDSHVPKENLEVVEESVP